MKNTFALITLLLVALVCKAQNKNFQNSFAGKWERVQRFHNLMLEIKFENNKDYATVTDIGTGEAPPLTFKANVKENKLIILPVQHQNDFYIELEIIKGKLHFRQQLTIWDDNGHPKKTKDGLKIESVYQRIGNKN